MLQEIGFGIAAVGALLTIIGTLVNNVHQRHRLAMKFWGISNPAMVVWAAGFILGYWTADLGIWAVLVIYVMMCLTNWYGLLAFRGRGLP